MQRYLRVVCLLLAAMLLFACGGSGTPVPEATDAPVVTPAPTEAPAEEVVVEQVVTDSALPTLPPRRLAR